MLLRLLIFTLFLALMNIFAQTPTIETGVTQTLAKWRATNYSDVRYKLNLMLEKMSPTLKGTIEISLENNADQIVLDWRKIRGKEDLSKVENIFVNGKTAKYEEINEHLVFKEGIIIGENVIKLDFTSPILTSGGAITRYIDKEDGAEYIYTLFVPSDASTAFPVFDQPDLKARFKLEVTSRTFDRVVSNAIGKTSDYNTNTDRFTFAETKPISTYVFAFAAGDFVSIQENPPKDAAGNPIKAMAMEGTVDNFRVFVRRSQAEKFKAHEKEVFRLNREGVKFLESYFDYKFPFPKYDLVLIPEFPFGGMEHAGATFLREDRIIFPTEPTKNDYITRANLIFHEAAHQWFGDTVTMRWFDDLWLKEGFAEFMAYKTLEKVIPEYNAWKIFYERNKQAAYLTDSTKGTTPIYQEIPNLASAKSAYGNIVYRKAPSFLKQAEFYLGEKEFQTAVRAFLKKHQFANAEWTDLVKEFETASGQDLKVWADSWVKKRGMPVISKSEDQRYIAMSDCCFFSFSQRNLLGDETFWKTKFKTLRLIINSQTQKEEKRVIDSFEFVEKVKTVISTSEGEIIQTYREPAANIYYSIYLPNYQDYGYGIFLLDEKSRVYVLKNIQNEKDDFLRTMMWGSLWDSVREAELAPKDYVELVIRNLNVETDESTIQTLLGRVSTAMNYYLSDKQREELVPQVEALLIDKVQNAPTLGQRITFYRAFLNIASSENARNALRQILSEDFGEGSGNTKMRPGATNDKSGERIYAANPAIPMKTKDRFDIVTKLLILGDKVAPQLLAELEKSQTTDEAKRYAYAAKAGLGTAENKTKFWNDFVNNKELSESWIESAFGSFNSVRHTELTLPYLDEALAELPTLKRNRKIFFVNGWLAAFIGGQRSEKALQTVNKFLTDNPNLDRDLRLKVLENVDALERAVKIRQKYAN